jgi:hypothetical protein
LLNVTNQKIIFLLKIENVRKVLCGKKHMNPNLHKWHGGRFWLKPVYINIPIRWLKPTAMKKRFFPLKDRQIKEFTPTAIPSSVAVGFR